MSFFPKAQASRPGNSQAIAIGAASVTLAAAFASETFQVRLATSGACHYRVVEAAGGTAVAADPLLPAGVVEYIIVSPGQKIAAIQDGSSTGALTVTEMS
jgi:hypothetical protein